MTVALLVITDGRVECLQDTVVSAREQLHGPISERWMFDDTGDDAHREWLRSEFPDFTHIDNGPRRGFGGAIRSAWRHLTTHSATPYIFHLEQDFTFNRAVDLDALAEVLVARPYLVQLALRRQAWNTEERAAGGFIEQHPDDYTEVTDGAHTWLEHRRFFTTNPSLYRRDLILKEPWSRDVNSEGRFTHQLLRSPKLRFGYWGARDSGEWVTHIGSERVGSGY